MAIPVIATTSSGSNNGTTLTLTKPTGLALGDLMVAIIGWDPSGTQPTLAGWTQINATTVGTTSGIVGYYRVATSGDVAAANFTFTGSAGSETIIGIIYRITGYLASGPISGSTVSGSTTGTVPSTFTVGTLTPANANSLLILSTYYQNIPSSSVGSYAIANASLTWTEYLDVLPAESMASAAAGYGSAAATGAATGLISGTSGTPLESNIFIAVSGAVDVSISASPISVTPGFFMFGLPISPDSISSMAGILDPIINTFSAKWLNTSKNTSSWDNIDKTL